MNINSNYSNLTEPDSHMASDEKNPAETNRYQFSIYKNLQDTYGKPQSARTFEEFVNAWQKPRETRATNPGGIDDKSGPMIGHPKIDNEKGRRKENLSPGSWCCIDFDHVDGEYIAALHKHAFPAFKCATWRTHSWTEEDQRTRALFALSAAPKTAADYRETVKKLYSSLNGILYAAGFTKCPDMEDESCTKISQTQNTVPKGREVSIYNGKPVEPVEAPQEPVKQADGTNTYKTQLKPTYSLLEGPGRAYAVRALQRECDNLSMISKGGRNEALNRSSFRLFQFVGSGLLERQEVIDALMQSCSSNGLLKEDGERACMSSIMSGADAGIKHPRDMPKLSSTLVRSQTGNSIASEVVENAPVQFFPVADRILNLYKERKNRPPAISTGLKHVDRLLNGGLRRGLYLIGAAPGMGKTALALQIADNIASTGRNVLFYSMEMVQEELIDRSLCRISHQQIIENSPFNLSGETEALTLRSIEDELRHVDDVEDSDKLAGPILEYTSGTPDGKRKGIAEHLMIVDTDDPYIEAIETSVNAFYDQNPDGVVFIDYLQLLRIAADPRTSADPILRLADISRRLKVLSKRGPLIVISSVNRDSYYSMPGLDAFKASGDIEFSANAAILMTPAMYTDSISNNRSVKSIVDSMRDLPKPLELHLVKGRALALGKCGIMFDGAHYSMESIGADEVTESHRYLNDELNLDSSGQDKSCSFPIKTTRRKRV